MDIHGKYDVELPPHTFPGNTTDDDGSATDSYFEAADQSPLEYDDIVSPVEDETPATTRMLVRRYSLTSDGTNHPVPVQVLPADPNRREVWIETDQTEVTIASDSGDCYTLAGFPGTNRDFYSSYHTGALWVYFAPSAAETAVITVRAVTI